VYVERLDDTITVDGPDGHHLERARRVRVGETVTASDGHGRWRIFTVTSARDGTVELAATSQLAHEAALSPRLTVAFSLTKGDKPELSVQKLTELGADQILVVQASRSVVRWDRGRGELAMDRLRRVAREAGVQSRRAWIPVVDGPVAPSELASHPGLVVAAGDGMLPHELAEPPGGEWLVTVGPEGGFDPDELAGFAAAPRLRLGPFVLRAETAAIAAAAALASRRTAPLMDDGVDRREW
jgi:16S rRNA (uracil1498-N3)-methyltransferase